MAVLKYQHAGARQREGMRLTLSESEAAHDLLYLHGHKRIRSVATEIDIPAARRALDKLRRALELYEVEHRD